ncbi:hypothetical protein ABNavy71_070 [Acinetobacter phage AB-Navy71]|nr:hypothetical protein ABNavy71_070 [Acinetobacter phage AB-Navy71]
MSNNEDKKLRKLVQNIRDAIHEAEAFADKHELDFYIQPAYGMGGTYDGETGEWHPSSQDC